ncbi:hypothetical protein C9374_013967 [Naegleria lovaniensis]|uniref:Uncharacterized protein n=1 Tax=Naegleria lovaniensis TaxID=51637 RepID=A0AA88GV12_NAELO|nr:uncharacterized protein C9374_013967 [Naegleria lovaniensis]KAG2389407.1 hypothetical protein C9374_013967 [Naegleria lovaniensis]
MLELTSARAAEPSTTHIAISEVVLSPGSEPGVESLVTKATSSVQQEHQVPKQEPKQTSSLRSICKSLSSKLAKNEFSKQESGLVKIVELMRCDGIEHRVQNYQTLDRVRNQLFSFRVPSSQALVQEIVWSDFSSQYFKSNPNNSPQTSQFNKEVIRLLEKEEIELRFNLKLVTTCSTFRPSKQSLEVQENSCNVPLKTIIGGQYYDSIYVCDLKQSSSRTKTFIILESLNVAENFDCNQSIHVFRIYGESLFTRNVFQSCNFSDISIIVNK